MSGPLTSGALPNLGPIPPRAAPPLRQEIRRPRHFRESRLGDSGIRLRYSYLAPVSILLGVDLNPLPVLFSEKDFKSHFPLSGNFVPAGQFFSGQPLNFLQIGSRKWGVGVKWLGGGRLEKMAARSDAAWQTPPGRPGLQHITIRPPSDATPPRYCRFSALPPYFRNTLLCMRPPGSPPDPIGLCPVSNGGCGHVDRP